jgi:imidazolonepropionase-like amidohydrolase
MLVAALTILSWERGLQPASRAISPNESVSSTVRPPTPSPTVPPSGRSSLQGAPSPELPRELDAQKVPTFHTGGDVFIKNGRILTVTHGFLDGADILIQKGKIVSIGKGLTAPSGIKVIDATGKFVTPGLVDAHSHRGEDDTNEVDAISAEVRITDVLDPELPGLYNALASGITTGLSLHGSANPIGGQSVVIKHKWRRPASEVIFPGAPREIKFALGENPTQWQGQRYPASRMGVETVYRRAFADARDYMRKWDEYRAHQSDRTIAPPRKDLRLEALAGILKGDIRVQCHSYRQDEILMMARLSKEFGFNLTLQHALESYKVAPELAAARIPVSIFGDAFAYKLEVIDSLPMASTILDKAGVLVSINTDTFGGPVPLTLDAAKAIRYGTTPDRALRMITINPAIELGIDSKVGSLDVGKDGDVAIWDGYPLSSYAKCSMTFIEGEPYFERRDQFGVDKTSTKADLPMAKAYDPSLPVPKMATSYLIVGATVHPISGPEQKNSTVLIEDGKIAAVGAKVEARAGTVRIDGKGLQVWPGMIDAGSQLGLIEFGQVPQATDANENGQFNPDLKATTAVNPDSFNFAKVRYNGITTARVFPSGGSISGQSGVIRTLSGSPEQMRLADTMGLDVNVPDGAAIGDRYRLSAEEYGNSLTRVRETRKALRERFEAAKRYLEAKDAGEPIATDIKQDAMRPYLEGKKPVLLHATNESAIRWALSFAKEMKLKAILVGAADAWRVTKEIKAVDVPVILTPPVAQCPGEDSTVDEFDPYDTSMALGAVLQRAGIRFAVASNDWETAMNLPMRAGRLCAFGLPHEAAMRALTLDAAKILGLDADLGSLEKGKTANVIITDGDPLEATTSLRYLFMDGKPVALESRYTDLYRRYMGRVKR